MTQVWKSLCRDRYVEGMEREMKTELATSDYMCGVAYLAARSIRVTHAHFRRVGAASLREIALADEHVLQQESRCANDLPVCLNSSCCVHGMYRSIVIAV